MAEYMFADIYTDIYTDTSQTLPNSTSKDTPQPFQPRPPPRRIESDYEVGGIVSDTSGILHPRRRSLRRPRTATVASSFVLSDRPATAYVQDKGSSGGTDSDWTTGVEKTETIPRRPSTADYTVDARLSSAVSTAVATAPTASLLSPPRAHPRGNSSSGTTTNNQYNNTIVSSNNSPKPPMSTVSTDPRHGNMLGDTETRASSSQSKQPMSYSFSRTESVSTTSLGTVPSARTPTSTDPSGAQDGLATPFIQRNGRTYYNDATLSYPLPADLTELHRQSLRTLLLIQIFGAPVCSPHLLKKPPRRVLEVGCGSGFWSMMCHRFFKGRGQTNIEFVGVDVMPIAPGSSGATAGTMQPDPDMNWQFVQHDLRQQPWPFASGEFDLVILKDMVLALPMVQHQVFIDEILRVLAKDGVYEVWETDNLIRMLRPHPTISSVTGEESEEEKWASGLGAYVLSSSTPLSAPVNTYLVEYNAWLSRALDARELALNPCTLIGPYMLQEAESLTMVKSRRFAIPFSELRWEREGVAGVVTKDGKSYVEMKGKGGEKAPHQKLEKKTLGHAQAALRRTALLTLVQQIQAFEPLLREQSGKSQDEWDIWIGKIMPDLMSDNGTSWGECLEVGAWWAVRK